MLYPMMTSELSAMVEQRIERLGISQRAYASKIGMSPSNLNGLLKGKIALPRPEARRRLAEDLGISHVDLLVMAGELFPEEIPRAGAIREPFPENDRRSEIVRLLHEIATERDAAMAWALVYTVVHDGSLPDAPHPFEEG